MYHFSDKYGFLLSDIKQVYPNEDEVKDDVKCADPEMVTSIKEYWRKELTTIAKLHDTLWIARTFQFGAQVTFVILDSSQIGTTILEFKWSTQFYWNNFGMGNPWGCCLTPAHARFNCFVSCCGQYLVIVGPITGTPRSSVPGVKVIQCAGTTKDAGSWTVDVCTCMLRNFPFSKILYSIF